LDNLATYVGSIALNLYIRIYQQITSRCAELDDWIDKLTRMGKEICRAKLNYFPFIVLA
jgi:hypothetical protein